MKLSELVNQIQIDRTILLFGAGSSIPSGSPSVGKLISKISETFSIDKDDFSLSEIASIAEEKSSRHKLILTLRECFLKVRPTGALKNLPLYDWANIYTTNYDTLIEQVYKDREKALTTYASNFDFTIQPIPEATKLYKLHGTIDKDVSDGRQDRIILTESDYDQTHEYQTALFTALQYDLNQSELIIIGYSLKDPEIKSLVNHAVEIQNKIGKSSTITLLLYTPNSDRASLYEKRGIRVVFGSLDDFFLELAKKSEQSVLVFKTSDNPLDAEPVLNPVTIDISHELDVTEKNAIAMFNGWPATYSDVRSGVTFSRTVTQLIFNDLQKKDNICVSLLGASGTGKTTVSRQVLLKLYNEEFFCWEHKNDHSLLPNEWRAVARNLHGKGKKGILFIDDAHNHIREINDLVDFLVTDEFDALKILVVSSRNHWNPRQKTPNIFKRGTSHVLKKLDATEIDALLNLIDTNFDIQPLIEHSFSGFTRSERKRRLSVRCESDTFVCLRNIFASESFDDIVLREFAELDSNDQEIYRVVSAMESSGVKVHRQLVIRMLGIAAEAIPAVLINLADIIHEYPISDREGIYGWKGRHQIITDIVTKYKMHDSNAIAALLERVIDNITPTYDIEIRTIRQLCNFESGINIIPNKEIRNKLLRKMMSSAPAERVPRHRLIRNLIDMQELEKAETEIRLFEHDLGRDGPVFRYKILLLMTRAENAVGIMSEDRLAILEQARQKTLIGIGKYPDNTSMLKIYCEVGIKCYENGGDITTFNDAFEKLKQAENRLSDPEITRLILQYERRISVYNID